MNPATILYMREQAAKPIYWLGWRLVRVADKLDGKHPKTVEMPSVDPVTGSNKGR